MNLKEISVSVIVGIVAFVFIFYGVSHNLDKPQPIRGVDGIVAFDTPDGRIEKGTPRFEELIASYEQK